MFRGDLPATSATLVMARTTLVPLSYHLLTGICTAGGRGQGEGVGLASGNTRKAFWPHRVIVKVGPHLLAQMSDCLLSRCLVPPGP